MSAIYQRLCKEVNVYLILVVRMLHKWSQNNLLMLDPKVPSVSLID